MKKKKENKKLSRDSIEGCNTRGAGVVDLAVEISKTHIEGCKRCFDNAMLLNKAAETINEFERKINNLHSVCKLYEKALNRAWTIRNLKKHGKIKASL